MAGADCEPLVSLADFERAAEALLGPQALSYVAGGAGDEITLRENRDAWRRIAIAPRVLVGVGVGQRDPRVTVLGRPRPHPLIIAPMALQRMVHEGGEIATAQAAEATGSVMCLSTLATVSAADVATAAPGASRWFQLYVFADRGVSRPLVAQAVEHGYEALVVTVDVPVLGVRERELRSGVRTSAVPQVPSARAAGARGPLTPGRFDALVDADLSWGDIKRLAAESPLPLLVKGILTAQDALLALENGAAGVIVSNHGGRQLDTVLSGADALPAIVDAVGDRVDVLVDGGIRRGTDVLKALALGAQAVLVGRPCLWGLAVDGAQGVQRVLEILLAEFDVALALTGARSAAALNGSFLTRAPWVEWQR
jgi:4-hydroxymandelate oxidase